MEYEVVTLTGLDVFEGTKKECEEYLDQALLKGSRPGFLTIQEKEVKPDDGILVQIPPRPLEEGDNLGFKA